jgi:hypothetical protein
VSEEAKMLSQAAPSHERLGFAPLPDNARQAVYDSLTACGFAREAILESYNFTGRDGDFTLNMLAFADRVRRDPAEYAGCTVYNATNGLPDRETVIIELGDQITVLQPDILVHRNQIILPFLTSHQCRI